MMNDDCRMQNIRTGTCLFETVQVSFSIPHFVFCIFMKGNNI